MSDERTRALQRQAANDPSARVALLCECMRAGERSAVIRCGRCKRGKIAHKIEYPDGASITTGYDNCPDCDGTGYVLLRDAVALAAYAGDPASREMLDVSEDQLGISSGRLEHWLTGLSRWPGALPRAAVAAGWAAHWTRENTCGDPCCMPLNGETCQDHTPERRALEAAECYLADPTEERREACLRIAREQTLPGWIWHTLVGIGEPPFAAQQKRFERAIEAAASLVNRVLSERYGQPCYKAGEDHVRKVICKALIGWCLDG